MPHKPQRIIVKMAHQFAGNYPDVPISPDVNMDDLTKTDIDEGREPFFVTLLLGEVGQESRNKRRYVDETATNAIYDAIWKQRIGGNKGHTPSDQQGTYFEVPVLHWIGAMIDESGVVWGKAYVPGASERQREMREYYRLLKATNGNAGTSLEGYGTQEWNDELECWDIIELDVHRIDAVEAKGVGIPVAGSMPPHITTEMVAPGELEVGDLVAWEENGELVRGEVNTIWEDGEHEVPYQDFKLIASEDNPLARMDVFATSYETGGWVRTNRQTTRYFSDLMKIERLPEFKEAVPDELSVGDFVRWQASGGTAQGRVETIERDGTISVPDSAFEIEGTSDDPAALIVVYQEIGNGWESTETRAGHKFSTLTKINPLPEPTETEETSVSNTFTEQDLNKRVEEARAEMRNKLDEQRDAYEQELTETQAELADVRDDLREANTTLTRLGSLLELADDADMVQTLRERLDEMEAMQTENARLLETTIEAEVAAAVKIEYMRDYVATKVRAANPATAKEVSTALEQVLSEPKVKESLKEAMRGMGPNIDSPYNNGDSDSAASEVTAYT